MTIHDPLLPPAPRRRDIDCTDPELRSLLLNIEGRRRRARGRLNAALGEPKQNLTRLSATTPSTVPTDKSPGTVLTLRRVAADLLNFTLVRPSGLAYVPGSSIKLSLHGVTRSYSMVSAPHERDLEFFVELLPGGRMASRLSALERGSRIGIASKAKRGLTLDPKASRHLMLATVTGVSPFVSLLRDAVHSGLRGVSCILVHGASYSDEFGYDEELRALAAQRPDLLTYIPTVSRPSGVRNADWQGAQGRADDHIESVCRAYGLTPSDTTTYACGNPGMVDKARIRLSSMNYRVHVERYS